MFKNIKRYDEKIKNMNFPKGGQLRTLRKILNISQEQLAKKMGVSTQAISHLEKREEEGKATIQKIREVAQSMGLDVFYFLYPKDGSLEKMVSNIAYIAAKKMMKKSSCTMELESQSLSKEKEEELVDDLAMELKLKMNKIIWD